MRNSIKLSTRLLKVASYLPKGAHFADIGSDHAYLPCYVCLEDNTATAIAGEVNEGPFQSAVKTVRSCHLENAIDVRLGDGLAVLKDEDRIDQIVIAGMGGSLIQSILEAGKEKLDDVEQIIAQPNIDAKSVRLWLTKHGFTITQEAIMEENGHIYEIIVGRKKSNRTKALTEKELFFGPILLKEKTPTFYKKWKNDLEKWNHIITEIKKAKNKDSIKLKQFEKELNWIEEVLSDE